jgi:hypothetical protein
MKTAVVEGRITHQRRSKYGPLFAAMLESLRADGHGMRRSFPHTAHWRHETLRKWRNGLKDYTRSHASDFPGFSLTLEICAVRGLCFTWRSIEKTDEANP